MTDVTIVSNCLMADGIGRQGIGLISAIKNDLKVNMYTMQTSNYKDVPSDVLPIVSKPFDGFAPITFWTYILGIHENMEKMHAAIQSQLKICYSMIESDAVPNMWVKFLNKYYDMVVVPDPWLVQVYKNSGVIKPIFILPLGIFIEKFLEMPVPTEANKPFTFGMSAGFWERKNHIKVMKAFAKAFGVNPDFKLKVHGRFGSFKEQVEKAYNSFNILKASDLSTGSTRTGNLPNIEFGSMPLTQKDYHTFMESLDCVLAVSKGEGFSIPPREALAMGKPVIITNNSAQQTICSSGFTFPIEAKIKTPAYYEVFKSNIGSCYDCSEDDLIKMMRYVADNYKECLEKAAPGREWVKQYLWSNLKRRYISLFKPTKVIAGKQNEITSEGIEININQKGGKELLAIYNKLGFACS